MKFFLITIAILLMIVLFVVIPIVGIKKGGDMKNIDLTETVNANELKDFKMKTNEIGGYVIEINLTGECAKNYKPDAFYNITGIADLSEMIQNNHLKILINGKEYWIPFVEKINKKGEK